MRKLVTLRKVKEIKPIVDADNIELARIDGWQCVVKKGEFEVGDLGIYFEVDSVLPKDERWSFMENSKWRVKTRTFRGALSQGLLLPLDIITEDEWDEIMEIADEESTGSIIDVAKDKIDLSDVFGVRKYIHPSELEDGTDTAGGFPGFLRKTDQERIQNLSDEYEEDLRFHPYEITEKLEGTSITIYYNSFIDEFGVCSRNLRKKRSNYPIWRIVDEVGYEDLLKEYGKPIALQGELIGPSIQGNHYDLSEHQFRIFDVWDISRHEYMIPMKRYNCLEHLFGGPFPLEHHVPVLEVAYTDTYLRSTDDLLDMADTHSRIYIDVPVEGLVFKSMGDPSISFKAINNNYLLNK